MAWQKNSRIEFLQILNGAFHLLVLTRSEMEAPDNSMERDGIVKKVDCVFRCVDHACMAATSKDDDSFV